jgi:hypothetical protein
VVRMGVQRRIGVEGRLWDCVTMFPGSCSELFLKLIQLVGILRFEYILSPITAYHYFFGYYITV